MPPWGAELVPLNQCSQGKGIFSVVAVTGLSFFLLISGNLAEAWLTGERENCSFLRWNRVTSMWHLKWARAQAQGNPKGGILLPLHGEQNRAAKLTHDVLESPV